MGATYKPRAHLKGAGSESFVNIAASAADAALHASFARSP